MKVELGSGKRPTAGYVPTDIAATNGHVQKVSADRIWYPSNNVDEFLALGVIEHLTYAQARRTFANVHRMLRPGGSFYFDVPDLPVWCSYLTRIADGGTAPFPLEHVLSTLYGWQRWDGDEHQSGWFRPMLDTELAMFATVTYGVDQFFAAGHDRRRFHRPDDAHLYVRATK